MAAVAAATEKKTKSVPAKSRLGLAKAFAKSFFIRNAQANALRVEADKVRKALYQTMKEGGIEPFNMRFEYEGSHFAVDVAVDSPECSYIDPNLARAMVPPEQFMQMISITKEAAIAVLGKDGAKELIRRAERFRTGTENVTVKQSGVTIDGL